MNNINVFDVLYNTEKNIENDFFIIEVETDNDSKRYFCLLKDKNKNYKLFKINSIGTLLEKMDQYIKIIRKISKEKNDVINFALHRFECDDQNFDLKNYSIIENLLQNVNDNDKYYFVKSIDSKVKEKWR